MSYCFIKSHKGKAVHLLLLQTSYNIGLCQEIIKYTIFSKIYLKCFVYSSELEHVISYISIPVKTCIDDLTVAYVCCKV